MTNKKYDIPVVIVKEMVLFPNVMIHLDVDARYNINAVKQAYAADGKVLMITNHKDDPKCALLATVKQLIKIAGKNLRCVFDIEKRVNIVDVKYENNSCVGEYSEFNEIYEIDGIEEKGMKHALMDIYNVYVSENGHGKSQGEKKLQGMTDIREMIDYVAMHIPLPDLKKIDILETVNVYDRFDCLIQCLSDEINISRYKREYTSKVKKSIDDNQKEYYLKEQMRLIRKELGEEDVVGEADIFEEKCEQLEADEDVKELILKEIKRFKKLSSNSSENAVVRGYIETLLALPWNKSGRDNDDIAKVQEMLDAHHYGLEKVKERIVELISVRKLTDKTKAPILCLVGPPGTGKTSIVKSVAEAMNKNYQRICLGGVRDEAEIRGHRKTYVGAMPGRLVNALKKAGVNNPVILLDEIDKVSNDYKGDTHSALLEVLDPEQNEFFTDHYIETPVDLSNVLFICTANTTKTIPQPLLDRMELVEIPGYTLNEKIHIAKEHLIQKQRENHGLKKSMFAINDAVIETLINSYTKEAGVRQLERTIGKLCRKAARLITLGEKKKVTVSQRNITEYLGKERYSYDKANEKDEVGVVRGLAWTSVGGDTLEIEVNIMRGKGTLELTGQMGDVMKESAKAALSFVRSESERYDVDEKFFEEHDIHIHIPEGAIPKDGPSAGITMTTATMSAVTGIKVRADVAMTGEVTLRGRVLAIGGLKEKLIAAKVAGIKEVLVPLKNKKDIEEMENEITNDLKITYVSVMKEVLEVAFVKEGAK